MTTFFIRAFLFSLCSLSCFKTLVQESIVSYLQPQIAVNYKVLPKYSHNLTLSSRNFIYREENLRLGGRNLDISHFSTFNSGVNTSFGAGLEYRLEV